MDGGSSDGWPASPPHRPKICGPRKYFATLPVVEDVRDDAEVGNAAAGSDATAVISRELKLAEAALIGIFLIAGSCAFIVLLFVSQ